MVSSRPTAGQTRSKATQKRSNAVNSAPKAVKSGPKVVKSGQRRSTTTQKRSKAVNSQVTQRRSQFKLTPNLWLAAFLPLAEVALVLSSALIQFLFGVQG